VTVSLHGAAIVKSLGGDRVLSGVDIDVRAGEIQALVGMNGAGKTTLMRILLGMLTPDSGSVQLFGEDLVRLAPAQWRRVGHLIEGPAPYPELTTRENLRVMALLRGMPRDRIDAAVAQVIDDLTLARWADRRARTLSLGTRQKLALGGALTHEPDVLVLDEPANALDPSATVRVRALLSAISERGGAVLVSSHHLDELARLADVITVLHRGVVVGALDPHGTDLEREFFSVVYQADQEMDSVSA
jgi:ABC-2 type transport system ATP-binding protein